MLLRVTQSILACLQLSECLCTAITLPPEAFYPPPPRETASRQTSRLRPAVSAYHILNDLILPVLPLHLQQMITEVKQVKAPLLAQQDDDGAAGPVQAVTEALPGVGEGKQ